MDLQTSVVYGPIHSRRLGRSLGINLLPLCGKFCNFNCVYCQYGCTEAKLPYEDIRDEASLLREIEAGLGEHLRRQTPIDCLTIAGNGEPTLHFQFVPLVEGILRLRDQYYRGIPVGILSNSSQAHRPEIRKALERLDRRYMKLDAGSDELFRMISRPRGREKFDDMVNGLALLKDIVIQSLFVRGTYANDRPEQIAAWINTIERIRPSEVQVYTIARRPADRAVEELNPEALKQIAAECAAKTGIRVEVYS